MFYANDILRATCTSTAFAKTFLQVLKRRLYLNKTQNTCKSFWQYFVLYTWPRLKWTSRNSWSGRNWNVLSAHPSHVRRANWLTACHMLMSPASPPGPAKCNTVIEISPRAAVY